LDEHNKWFRQQSATYRTLECKHITVHQARHHSTHPQPVVSVQQPLLTGRHVRVFYIKTNVENTFKPDGVLPAKCWMTQFSTFYTTRQKKKKFVEGGSSNTVARVKGLEEQLCTESISCKEKRKKDE